MKYYVYIHRTPSNKTYVGVTMQNPEKRWQKGRGYRNNKHFYNAIQKYGWDNVSHEVIEVYSEEWMYELEQVLIALLHSNEFKYGYNRSVGGEKASLKYLTEEEKNTAVLGAYKKYYKGHKEKHIEYWKQYYEEHKEELKEYIQQYNERNDERIRLQHQQYYEEHKDERKQYLKEWHKAHSDYSKERREYMHQYYEKKKLQKINK